MLHIKASVVYDCPKIKDPFEAYFVNCYPQIFYLFRYSTLLAWYAKFINITATFVWSFCDLFVIIISVGLATRFKQINDNMLMNKGKVRAQIKIINVYLNQFTKYSCLLFTVHDARLLGGIP